VQERILNPLSMRLLDGEFKPGDKIKVSANNGELVLSRR
jgi:ATP-dependent Clp protease ATP-binding subunit ClpA